MNKLIISIALLFALAATAQGQKEKKGKPDKPKKEIKGDKEGKKGKDGNNLEERAEKLSQRWKTELNLDENQRITFKQAKLNQLIQKKAVLEKYKGNRKEAGAEIRKINQEFRDAVKTGLGETKYNEWVARKKEKYKKIKDKKDKKLPSDSSKSIELSEDEEEDDGVE